MDKNLGNTLSMVEYLVNSNNNADCVNPKDRYKYIDDLSILHLVMMTGLLTDYDFQSHVASDIPIDTPFLPPGTFGTQSCLDNIADWITDNMMKINHDKSNYIVFSRSKQEFSTRLNIENIKLDRETEIKMLGVWLTEDMRWSKNTKEICKKVFQGYHLLLNLSMLG